MAPTIKAGVRDVWLIRISLVSSLAENSNFKNKLCQLFLLLNNKINNYIFDICIDWSHTFFSVGENPIT